MASADQWIGDGGEFIAHAWLSQLCALVQERFLDGDYERSSELFDLVDQLLEEGDDSVKTAIATGFIEGLQHLPQLDPALWKSLLGRAAQAHYTAMNNFHGISA